MPNANQPQHIQGKGEGMYKIYEKLRNARGLTDYKVAKEAGVSRSTLSEWKNGEHKPSLETIQKLSKYFGTTVDYLLGSNE